MIKVCLCYNQDSELLDGALRKSLGDCPDVTYESWNESAHTERKKAFGIKGHFAARATPFCGVFRDDNAIKGFYSEVGECTLQNITDFVLAKTGKPEQIQIPD